MGGEYYNSLDIGTFVISPFLLRRKAGLYKLEFVKLDHFFLFKGSKA